MDVEQYEIFYGKYGSIPMGKLLLKAHRVIRFWEYNNGTQ